jgi:hypothetical protein
MPRPKTGEYDEPRPRPDSGGSGKLLLILGAVFLGVLLLCGVGVLGLALGVVGLSPSGWHIGPDWNEEWKKQAEAQWKQQDAAARSDQEHAKALLDYWLALVRFNHLDEAYQRTSAAFQARLTRDAFERFIQQNADLKTTNPGWSYGLDGKPGTRFTFILSRPKGSPYGLTVVREGGEWKLDTTEGR